MIRPQNKAKKAHEEMVNGIEVGDEVVSSGGLLGRVTKISDQFFEVNLGDNTKVKIQRASITNVLPKGTINSI
jgi:preprotein translocase subunit YajC